MAITMTTAAVSILKHATAIESPGARFGWYSPRYYLGAFGTGETARQAAKRWRDNLPDEYKRTCKGRIQVRGDAKIIGDLTLHEYCQAVPSLKVSDEVKGGSTLQREKQIAAAELVNKIDQTRTIGPAVEIGQESQEAIANRAGLGLSEKTLKRYRRRLDRGELIDKRRGRSGRKPSEIDERIQAAYDEIALHPNFKKYKEAWRNARDVAQAISLPMPSDDTMLRDFRKRVPAVAVAYSKSPRKFEAANLPKIHREYTDIAPMEWISLDGTVLNCRCQAPDCVFTGKLIRPILTVVLDIRTRMVVGWDIRSTESSDGILAGLKMMHRDYGCARHYYADNGKAYGASVGKRRRRQVFDDPRIGGLCAQTGAERHNALPRQGWSKMVESHHRSVNDGFARYFVSWWGNSIENRPDDAGKLRPDQHPTLDDVRRAFAEYLKAHHCTPQTGHGMYGLSPLTVMEQCRT